MSVDGRATVVQPVAHGLATLVPDPYRPAGWTLRVDGVDQSYVDMDDPTHLAFGYMRRLALVVDALADPGEPVRVLHLGGGAFSMPRYVAWTRPGSGQRVIEHDPALLRLVLRTLPLPPGEPIEVELGDARTSVEAADRGRYDLVVGDVYRAAQMPRSVSSVEFAAQVAALLDEGGQYAVNLVDLPLLAFTRRQVATLRAVFADVGLLAEPNLLRGRRYGNAVLVASVAPDGLAVQRLSRMAARGPFPATLLHGAELAEFAAAARPVTDAEAEDSPVPPPAQFP